MIDVRVENVEAIKQELEKQLQMIRRIHKKTIKNLAFKVQARAKDLVPRKTSTLGRSISVDFDESGDRINARVGTWIEYGPFVEFGTGIYSEAEGAPRQRIRPTEKQALKFTIGQETIFAKSIAGMEPRPYLRPALRQVVTEQVINRIIRQHLG